MHSMLGKILNATANESDKKLVLQAYLCCLKTQEYIYGGEYLTAVDSTKSPLQVNFMVFLRKKA